MGKWPTIRKIQGYVYWRTKMETQEEDIMPLIESCLKKHPEYIPIFMENADVILTRCKGTMNARKEEFVS